MVKRKEKPKAFKRKLAAVGFSFSAALIVASAPLEGPLPSW